MDYMLSNNHQQMIEHIEGPLLVNAAPGTGMQTATIKRLGNILRTFKGNYRILILTFNRLMAQQFKERIHNEIENDGKDKSDRFFIGTIHQFARDIVETRGDILGLKSNEIILIDSIESENILKNILISRSNTNLSFQNSDLTKKTNLLRDISSYISRQKRELKQPLPYEDIVNNVVEFYDSIYYEYDLYLKARSLIDIDDLILLAYRIINERPSINEIYQRIYKFACVFDVQDLTYASYQLLQTLYPDKNSNIMFVGDKHQAIYSFTGASTSYMKHFETYYNPIVVKLTVNYRSSSEIISLSQKLIPSLDAAVHTANKGEVLVREFEDEDAEATWIAENTLNLVKLGHQELTEKIRWDNIAIIARNRSMLRRIEKQFIKRNIPFANKTFGILESESTIMQVFELGLRLIINHQDKYYLELFQSLMKLSRQNTFDHKNPTDNGITLLKHFESLIGEEWKYSYKTLLQAWSLLCGPEIKFTDSLLLLEKHYLSNMKVENAEELNVFMSDLKMWRDFWQTYILDTNEYNLIGFKNKLLSLSKTHGSVGVRFLTAHSSKGLEFDVVHIVGVNEGVFPISEKSIEEDRQILYVAISRAKRLLYLSYTKSSSLNFASRKRKPSRFLKEMGLL
ncbi:hypothetical protein QD46_18155 [Paenibacillus polymyxa]|uniref:ATP-dependent helicase n=1 Tax=Paenibacillus polymyxa TaxID=1406 RepID=UPI0005CEF5B1|nr:ATP-dependent helicase [Paenibacillus polymyxa]KJD38588.1 hypothetical protein QD46_18155 [Paenibacillus polymyxa]